MVDAKLFEKLSARIKNCRNDFIELERLLTSIPALGPINGGKGEWPKAKALWQYFAAAALLLFLLEIFVRRAPWTFGLKR